MVSLISIIVGIAIILAVIVTAVVVGVCLMLAWATKSGDRGPTRQETRGQPGAPTAMRGPSGSRHRGGHGAPMGSRRVNR